MTGARPNVLLIMTDEERYPPPYEVEALAAFRRRELPARQRLRERSRELHRHYVGSTACVPSRATLFTGQYPSLHGVDNTDGLAKSARDPGMTWLAPGSVPTLGDWFRAGGYQTHYRGKWHISHADLFDPETRHRIATNDATGAVDAAAVARYREADPLASFGFSGWIGREPHGADPADCGVVKDGLYAEQVTELFAQLVAARDAGPWLAVASFVNPHDIAFSGAAWELFGYPPPDDAVPDIAPAPSQSDPFTGRPTAQREFFETWPKILYDQATDNAYRRLYHHLHRLVDQAVVRILDALEASGMADDTILLFTSDHGDLVGAHGGLVQKWHNAYDEAIRVPFLVSGPGIDENADDVDVATSHVDVLPTLLGLAGIDTQAAAAELTGTHRECRPLPGRDLSPLLAGRVGEHTLDAPIYFMTEDEITRGSRTVGLISREPFSPVAEPARIESVIARLPTGVDGSRELWKLNRSFARLHGDDGGNGDVPDDQWEAHNLTTDPEERHNVADVADREVARLRELLDSERDRKRLVPEAARRP
ncbi:MAG TPA: sulfatase-like hydrolase/transferase [Acidimicrobiia bacterium]